MKFKSLKTLSILGVASLTLISCGSKPKSISCDGYQMFGASFKFTADQEKIVIKTDQEAEADPNMDFDNQGSTDVVKKMAKSAMNRRK